MNWNSYATAAERLLGSSHIPSSEEIISLIKRVNPTSLQLCETERERGYRLKNELQNLLLENYGESFHLASHPYHTEIVLIKHNFLPSIDACHTDLKALSARALDVVGVSPSVPVQKAAADKTRKGRHETQTSATCAKDALKSAQALLQEYEYSQAEEVLAAIRIGDGNEVPTLVKAARMLVEEMGAYEQAIAMLLSQPTHVLKDKVVRELLALTYYGNAMVPEARALFDTAHLADLGKNALCAYADISFKDGNLLVAYRLLKLAEEKEGYLPALPALKKEIVERLLAEAEPWLQQARAALARHEVQEAESLVDEALRRYPNYHEARQLLAAVQSTRAREETKSLWEEFRRSQKSAEKLDLLGRLLERDKDNVEEITHLVAKEKAAQKTETVENRLEILRVLAADKKWGECFDVLQWLSRQELDAERESDLFRISPYFAVLHQNRKLQRIPNDTAKELWLTFVKVRSRIEKGETDGCFELVQGIRQYFRTYPLFQEMYDQLLVGEQEKAWRAVQEQLAEMLDESCTAEQARMIAARMRKPLALLPSEDRALYRKRADFYLQQFEPVKTEEETIDEYDLALRMGNSSRAASLRTMITDDEAARSVERAIADDFAIDAEPITVTVSPKLTVDLATASKSLVRMGRSDRHVVFREGEETIVVVNLRSMTATRFHSAKFQNLMLMDCIPDKDLFLFRDTSDWCTMLRAELADGEGCFTAIFDVREHFVYEELACFQDMYMSCSKDYDYYALIQEGERLRMVKQSLDITSNTVRSHHINEKLRYVFRLSYQRDCFGILTDSSTIILDNNLNIPRGCSRLGQLQSPPLYGLDALRSELYVNSGDTIKVLNTKLRIVRDYPNAYSAGYLSAPGTFSSICTTTGTALLRMEQDKGVFYDLHTNRFSQGFSITKIMWTEAPTRWHYFEYDGERSEIIVKEITDELEGLLEWQILASPDKDDETNGASICRMCDPEFFTVPGFCADINAAPEEN